MSVRPHGYRIAVQPTPVEVGEEQRPSGLIVQHSVADSDGTDEPPMQSGVVVDISPFHEDDGQHVYFEKGSVVYYRYFDNIRDIHIVATGHVLAWE